MPLTLNPNNKYQSLLLQQLKLDIIDEILEDHLKKKGPLRKDETEVKAYLQHIATLLCIIDNIIVKIQFMPKVIFGHYDNQFKFLNTTEEHASNIDFGIDLDFLNNFETEFLKRYTVPRLLDILNNLVFDSYLEIVKQRTNTAHLLTKAQVLTGINKIVIRYTNYCLITDAEKSISWLEDYYRNFIDPKQFIFYIKNHQDCQAILQQIISQASYSFLLILAKSFHAGDSPRLISISRLLQESLAEKKKKINQKSPEDESEFIIENHDDFLEVLKIRPFSKSIYESAGVREALVEIINKNPKLDAKIIQDLIQFAIKEHALVLISAIRKRYPELVSEAALKVIFFRQATLQYDKCTLDISDLIQHVTDNNPNFWQQLDNNYPGIVRRLFIRATVNKHTETINHFLSLEFDMQNLCQVSSYGNGMNAFHLAMLRGHEDIAGKILKVPGGAALAFVQAQGNEDASTPLHFATNEQLINITSDLLAIAAKQGGDCAKNYILTPAITQKTALHYASLIQEGNALSTMLTMIPDADLALLKDQHGLTPLHYTAEYGLSKNAKSLIEYDKGYALTHPTRSTSLIDVQDNKGKTTLHYTALVNHKLLPILLQHGAKPHIKDHSGITALHQAIDAGQQGNIDILLKFGGKTLAAIKSNIHDVDVRINYKNIAYSTKGFVCDENLHVLILESGFSCVLEDLKNAQISIVAYYAHGFKSYLMAMHYQQAKKSHSLENFTKRLKALDNMILHGAEANLSDVLYGLRNEILSIQTNIQNRRDASTRLTTPSNDLFDAIPDELDKSIEQCMRVGLGLGLGL